MGSNSQKSHLNLKASQLNITVLGGGGIGITQAIIFKLCGFNVKVFTAHNVEALAQTNLKNQPLELASIYAAASVIPHSVNHPKENEILTISQKFFTKLSFSTGFGVRKQKHFEIFEYEKNAPEYARAVEDFKLFSDNGSSWIQNPTIPRRKGADKVWGWSFNSFFVEVPTYIDALYKLYYEMGGIVENKKIEDLEEISNLDSDIIINCMGRWSIKFFPEDKKNTSIIRGHLVKIGIHEVPSNTINQYFSYNYSPLKSIYARQYETSEGIKKCEHADVYFYPRSDGWILGGSRQEGYPEIGEPWKEDDEGIFGKTKQKIHWDIPVPTPIWNLNRELLIDLTGIDIDNPKYPSCSYQGYRFKRNPIRMEIGNEISPSNKILIHNYGHGGAGYTLSWGSAFEVIKLIEEKTNVFPEIKKFENLSSGYISSTSRILQNLIKDAYIERNKAKFIPYKE